MPKFLLFLRHVKKIEVYVEDIDDEGPCLQYYADVTSRQIIKGGGHSHSMLPLSNFDQLKYIASNGVFALMSGEQSSDWNAVSNFIVGPGQLPLSKESFYSKLERTSIHHLPRTRHVVKIKFEDFGKTNLVRGNIRAVSNANLLNKALLSQEIGKQECKEIIISNRKR